MLLWRGAEHDGVVVGSVEDEDDDGKCDTLNCVKFKLLLNDCWY
jgi:hypothetical protein